MSFNHSINTNGIDDFLDLFEESQIEAATEDGLDAAAMTYFDAKLERVQETYDRPIPTNPDGSPKWERSGDWKSGQRIETESGERRIVDTGNAAEPISNYPGGYAERVANLNSSRRNPAAEIAFEDSQDDAEEVFEAAFLKRLGL